ncbi:MAG: helix-turn-helix domain-containing protein [Syntrophales bacterium]
MSAGEGDTRQDGLRDLVETYERDLITDALKITLGNQSHAARLLGTSKRTINYKVQKYAIELKRFKLTRLKTKRGITESNAKEIPKSSIHLPEIY